MLEVMEEFDLIEANTLFKPTRKAARNTGSATYCPSKSYVQKKHKRYNAPQPPTLIDYVLLPARFRSSLVASRVNWKFSRFNHGVIYDHGCPSAEDLTAGQRWERVKNCTSAAMRAVPVIALINHAPLCPGKIGGLSIAPAMLMPQICATDAVQIDT